ncbi:MAG: hypothetical protein HYR60_25300, partial [Acidobacteria bacterium]|nr:hypothetical protein [Acidobacteriota bacterium]
MTDPKEARKLLGGYAAGNLTGEERERLFAAALRDQELFDELAREETLREALSDPALRRQLLETLDPAPRSRFAWLWKPRTLTLAGTFAVTALVAVVWQARERQRVTEIAVNLAASPTEQEAQPKVLFRKDNRDTPRAPRAQTTPALRDELKAAAPKPAEAPAPKPAPTSNLPASPAPPPAAVSGAVSAARPLAAQPVTEEARKMRLAVLSFQEGAPTPDVSQAVSDRLNKKLDASAFSMVNRNEVDKALQERQVAGTVDADTAASIGRSLGADAVIVANVEAGELGKAKDEKAGSVLGGAAGVRRETKTPLRAGPISLTARAIDTRTAANVAFARGRASVDQSVDQVAGQLNSQLGQLNRPRLDGAVTDVNA